MDFLNEPYFPCTTSKSPSAIFVISEIIKSDIDPQLNNIYFKQLYR